MNNDSNKNINGLNSFDLGSSEHLDNAQSNPNVGFGPVPENINPEINRVESINHAVNPILNNEINQGNLVNPENTINNNIENIGIDNVNNNVSTISLEKQANQVNPTNQGSENNIIFNNQSSPNNIGQDVGINPQVDVPSGFGQINNEPAPLTDTLVEPTVNIIVPEKETVGKIPPKKEESKKMNKALFIALIVVLIFGIAFGIYYFLTMMQSAPIVKLEPKTFDINADISGDINDYATLENVDSNNCVIDLGNVDTSKEGTYDYSVVCEETTVKSTITIVDNREFIIDVSNQVFYKNAEITVDDLDIECSKGTCEYLIVDESIFKSNLESTGGPYELTIMATDSSGNTEQVKIEYYVILAYFSAEKDEELSKEYNVNYVEVDTFYINDSNEFMGIAYRTYTYDFSKDTESYNALKEELADENEFDGYAGTLIFDDEDNTITVQVALTSTTLDIEYGDIFPVKYSEIRDYYKAENYYTYVTK